MDKDGVIRETEGQPAKVQVFGEWYECPDEVAFRVQELQRCFDNAQEARKELIARARTGSFFA